MDKEKDVRKIEISLDQIPKAIIRSDGRIVLPRSEFMKIQTALKKECDNSDNDCFESIRSAFELYADHFRIATFFWDYRAQKESPERPDPTAIIACLTSSTSYDELLKCLMIKKYDYEAISSIFSYILDYIAQTKNAIWNINEQGYQKLQQNLKRLEDDLLRSGKSDPWSKK